MKDDENVQSLQSPEDSDSNLLSMLQQIQQQISALDEKIELLISKSPERGYRDRERQDRPYPRRPFVKSPGSAHPRRHGAGGRGPGRGSRDGDGAQPFYAQRPRNKKQGLNPRRKHFSPGDKDRD